MKHDDSHCGSFTIDVEEWFHILDSAATPNIEQWPVSNLA